MKLNSVISLVTIVIFAEACLAGPIAMGLCQTACNAGYVLCVTQAGAIAGTFALGVGVPAALFACSAIQGTCMAACAPLLAAPTP